MLKSDEKLIAKLFSMISVNSFHSCRFSSYYYSSVPTHSVYHYDFSALDIMFFFSCRVYCIQNEKLWCYFDRIKSYWNIKNGGCGGEVKAHIHKSRRKSQFIRYVWENFFLHFPCHNHILLCRQKHFWTSCQVMWLSLWTAQFFSKVSISMRHAWYFKLLSTHQLIIVSKILCMRVYVNALNWIMTGCNSCWQFVNWIWRNYVEDGKNIQNFMLYSYSHHIFIYSPSHSLPMHIHKRFTKTTIILKNNNHLMSCKWYIVLLKLIREKLCLENIVCSIVIAFSVHSPHFTHSMAVCLYSIL